MNLRVCFVRMGASPLFIPASEETFGGAEVRALTFARALARRKKHSVSFAVREADGLPQQTAEGITILPLPHRARGLRKLFGSMRRRLTSQRIPFASFPRLNADVVACFGIHDPSPNVIAAARHSSVRSLLFLTSSEDVCPLTEATSMKQRRTRSAQEFALRHADEVLVQTEFQQQHLTQRFGRQGVLIRNPIDLSVAASPHCSRGQYVLWVGRADCDSKRADVCLALARKCHDIPFRVVMNDSGSEYGQQLVANLPPNVTIEQHVPLDAIDERFANASMLINTSVSEGFPNAFLQAAKFSIPIVSLSVDPDQMLSQSGCGLVAGEKERMAELIRSLHLQPEVRDSIGRTARRYVEERHSLESCTSDLERVIDQVTRARQVA